MQGTKVLVGALGALAIAMTANGTAWAQAPGYDEYTNWQSSYGRTVDDWTDADKTSRNFLTSAQHALDAADETDRFAAGQPQYQIAAWPWNGDPYREDYDGLEVRFQDRNDQTIAATIFPARSGELADDGRVPGVVINEGSLGVQAMYFWAAHELANAGYHVVTFDVIGQGKSESGPISADNLRDTIDWVLSSAEEPHAFGGEVPFNPLHGTVDPDRIGTAGHSMGAGHVQSVGDYDGKVKAISAWSDMRGSYDGDAPLQGQGADYETWILPTTPTPDADETEKISRMDGIRDLRADADKDPIDLQEIVIEAGSHMAWSHVTWSYTSSWSEAVAFHYALAWFDRHLGDDHVRDGKSATERLTSNFDADGEGHGLSKKYLSAYDLEDLEDDDAPRFVCDNMVWGDC